MPLKGWDSLSPQWNLTISFHSLQQRSFPAPLNIYSVIVFWEKTIHPLRTGHRQFGQEMVMYFVLCWLRLLCRQNTPNFKWSHWLLGLLTWLKLSACFSPFLTQSLNEIRNGCLTLHHINISNFLAIVFLPPQWWLFQNRSLIWL